MSVFDEMDKLIAPGKNLHCYFVGNCTAYGSPGKFALVKRLDGHTAHSAEGRTSEEAMRKLINKLKPRKMPGM